MWCALARFGVGKEAVAGVDHFEGEVAVLLGKADLGGGAAGMALNVGETLLNDAEESDFERLREAVELGVGEKVGLDAAALGEALGVFLEGGNQAEIIEKRGVEEIGEGADLAGHLLGEGAGFFKGVGGNLIVGRERLADLGEAEIDGEYGLREAIVEFAAEAAALFVLEI